MGGPCRNVKTNVAAPDSHVAKYARPSSKGHPLTHELTGRVANFERCERTSKTRIHKPGSQNRHK
jgi:hypothetical protein